MPVYPSAVRRAGLHKLILMLSLVLLCGCAAHQRDLRPDAGFRDIAWGASIEDEPTITLMDKGGGSWKWATREPEQLKLGDVDVESITYIYIDGEFAGVDVAYSGVDRFSQLMQQLGDTLGPPNVLNKKMKMLSWNRNGATVLLRYYSMQGHGTLKYTLDRLASR